MYRIDSDNFEEDANGSGKDGFSNGDPTIPVGATVLDATWLNALQEEIATFIEDMGLALDKTDTAQLSQAKKIQAHRQALVNLRAQSHASGYVSGFGSTVSRDTGGAVNVVAVGGAGEIETAGGGDMTWTKRTQPGAYAGTYRCVCLGTPSGSDLFVAVGSGGAIHTSPDGVTWTARTAAAAYASEFFFVGWLNSQFIAVGTTGEIQTSPDGITWTHRTAGSSYSAVFRAAAYGGGTYVAVGASGEIQTSVDNGVTWVRQVTGSLLARGVTYGNGTFVAIFGGTSDTGCVKTSPDGMTWTTRSLAAGTFQTSNNMTCIVFIDPIFVLCCDGGVGEIQHSTDGVTWKRLPRFQYVPLNISVTARGNWIIGTSTILWMGAAAIW